MPDLWRVAITRLLLCVLLLTQLVSATPLPRAWLDSTPWSIQSLCSVHEDGSPSTDDQKRADECCALMCCTTAISPQGDAFFAQPVGQIIALIGGTPSRISRFDGGERNANPPRAPPISIFS